MNKYISLFYLTNLKIRLVALLYLLLLPALSLSAKLGIATRLANCAGKSIDNCLVNTLNEAKRLDKFIYDNKTTK